ncbi:MAG: hypothetical protein ACR2FY_24440 [Pirellulaceae bacterium]
MSSQPKPTRKFYPPRFSLQAVMIYMTLFCLLFGFVRFITYHDEAINVSAEEANLRFAKAWTLLRLPNEASRVNMYAGTQSGGADFEISKKAFLAWCDEQGWKLEELRTPPPAPPIYCDIGPDDIRHCFFFSNATHRGGWIVIYDINRQRAWVHHSPR